MTQRYNITDDFKEEVRNSTNIVDLIGRYVRLRRTGKNYLGICPFHDDHKPSMNVSPERQLYKCFACGAGGDVFSFLMNHENMSFIDAVVELAKEAGLKIPEKSAKNVEQEEIKSRLVEANEAALAWFKNNLTSEPGKKAWSYLLDRGLTESVLQEFEIGLATGERTALIKSLSGKFAESTLVSAGLAQELSQSGNLVDRFTNRIIVPIRATGGRLVAFGGRILDKGEPKYLNSPETPLFSKSHTLFGLFQGLKTIRKTGFAILVEGYFDVIALQQHEFRQAVAPLGTSMTSDQARLLKRYCNKVVICMDADKAGKRAAARAAGILFEHEFAVNVIQLPEGEDPDSFVTKNGKEAMTELIKKSEPAYYFVLKNAAESTGLSRPQGKKQVLAAMIPLLQQIKDPIDRSHSITETAQLLGISEHIVTNELRKNRKMSSQKKTHTSMNLAISPIEQELLQLSINFPQISKKAVEEFAIIEYVSSFVQSLLPRIFDLHEKEGNVDIHKVSASCSLEEEKKLLAGLAVSEIELQENAAWQCAAAIAINGLKNQLENMGRQLTELERKDPKSTKIDEIFQERIVIIKRIDHLESIIRDRNISIMDKKVV